MKKLIILLNLIILVAKSQTTIQFIPPGSGGTVSVSQPTQQIVTGTGSSITSQPYFRYDSTSLGLLVGYRNTGTFPGSYNVTQNPMITMARIITDATYTNNTHGIEDCQVITRTLSTASHNSYRSNVKYNGGAGNGHNSMLENELTVTNNTTLQTTYDLYMGVTVDAGSKIDVRYGPIYTDYSGAGVINEQTAYYVPALTKGNFNFAFRSEGAPIWNRGDYRMVTNGSSTGDVTSKIQGYFNVSTPYTGTKTNEIFSKLNPNSTEWVFMTSQAALNASYEIFTLRGDKLGSTAGVGGLAKLQADLYFPNVGQGLIYTSGSNARAGNATLVTGTATILNNSVTANTRIKLTIQGLNGGLTVNAIGVTAKTNGVGFVITSSDPGDSSTVYWELVEVQ